MAIRITGSQTNVPGEILQTIIGDPANTSTHNVTTSFTNFLNTLTFEADRRAVIIKAYFWAEKTTSSGDQELILRLTNNGSVLSNSARRFHIFTEPASAQMVTCIWSLETVDGTEYNIRAQVSKGSSSQTINIRAGGEYPGYIFQAIGI